MAIPANLTSVVLRGTFITPEGDPSTGTISFTPSSWLINSGANVSIPNSTITKTLGTAGDFEVTLPVTDDADVSPDNWVYSVSEVVDGVSQSYNILLPGTVGGTAYLADIAPAAAAGPEYYSLASSLTIGTVTTLPQGSAATAEITGLAPTQTLNLGIPGGIPGTAATITVGTVTSVAYGGTASVTNSGTSGSAVLDFVLVTGPQGDLAGLSASQPLDYTSNNFSLLYGAGLGTATGGTLVADLSDATPQALGAAAAGTAETISRADHVHATPSAADVGAVGTATTITAGTGLAGGGDLSASRTLDVEFSDSTPQAPGTGAAGTAQTASRADHVHDEQDLSGLVPYSVFSDKGSLLAASAASTPANLAVGTDGYVLTADSTETLGMKWAEASGGTSTAPQLLTKADLWSVCLSKTGAGTAEIKAGTSVLVGTTLVSFGTATSITMPSLTAGTDYYVYVKDDGTAQAVAATGAWPTPVASPPANSQLIGGFHYAPGGNATGTSGGDTTPAINEYSMWDLKWRPTSLDPRGMTLVADSFWMDIYLLNRDPDTNGTSKYNVDIADGATGGTTTPIVPAKFGGNGSTRYATMSWWNTAECLTAYGKRLPSVAEAAAAFYGTTENSSAGTDPVTTQLRQAYTSKWGVMLATGNMRIWGEEHGGGTAAASWANTNGGRGQVYQQENAVILGGGWNNAANAGSRSAAWDLAPSASGGGIGGRGACDHLLLV